MISDGALPVPEGIEAVDETSDAGEAAPEEAPDEAEPMPDRPVADEGNPQDPGIPPDFSPVYDPGSPGPDAGSDQETVPQIPEAPSADPKPGKKSGGGCVASGASGAGVFGLGLLGVVGLAGRRRRS